MKDAPSYMPLGGAQAPKRGEYFTASLTMDQWMVVNMVLSAVAVENRGKPLEEYLTVITGAICAEILAQNHDRHTVHQVGPPEVPGRAPSPVTWPVLPKGGFQS